MNASRGTRTARTFWAGVLGGIAGSLAMAGAQYLCRPWLQKHGHLHGLPDAGVGYQAAFRSVPEPTVKTLSALFPGGSQRYLRTPGAALVVHLGFGVGVGLVYTAGLRRFRVFRRGRAVPFGFALWLGAAEVFLPLLDLSRTPSSSSRAVQVFGCGAHILFATTLEAVCRPLLT